MGGSLDLLKVCHLKKLMFCKRCDLEISGKTHSNAVTRITKSGSDIKPIKWIGVLVKRTYYNNWVNGCETVLEGLWECSY